MISAEPLSMATRRRLLKEVPPFRPVAVKLLRLVGDPSTSLAMTVSLLRTDAVLSSEVLRLANSPLFPSGAEVKTVLHALAFLGLNRINSVIVTTALRGVADSSRSRLSGSCWRHNLATALICQRLAPLGGLSPEPSYIAGLIHDIGRLGLLRVFPEYEDALLPAAARGEDPAAVERARFEIDHAEAGRWLLAQWGCPLVLQNVAAFHGNPPANHCDGELISLVHAASRLAGLMGLSAFPGVPARFDLPETAMLLPEISRPQVLAGFAELSEWVVTRVNGIELSML